MIAREHAEHFWPWKPNADEDDALDRRVEVRVLVDDDRVLAAHLEDRALDPDLSFAHARRGLVDAESDFLGAGERDETRLRMLRRCSRRSARRSPGRSSRHPRGDPLPRGARRTSPRSRGRRSTASREPCSPRRATRRRHPGHDREAGSSTAGSPTPTPSGM